MTEVQTPAPIEAKVKAATYGAGIGGLLGQLINLAIDQYVITPHVLDGNPPAVAAAITIVAGAAASFAAGYWARHSPRP